MSQNNKTNPKKSKRLLKSLRRQGSGEKKSAQAKRGSLFSPQVPEGSKRENTPEKSKQGMSQNKKTNPKKSKRLLKKQRSQGSEVKKNLHKRSAEAFFHLRFLTEAREKTLPRRVNKG